MANKINIENYEAYLLDYMEGNLSKEDVVALQSFIVLRPELDIDLSELELVELNSDALQFEGKNELKKSPAQLLSDEQYINYIENNLTAQDRKAVEAIAAKYPEAHTELELYKKTIVTPDSTIVFENKSSLKKETKVLWLFSRQTLSMAAAILLLVAFVVLFRLYNNGTTTELSSNKNNSITNTTIQKVNDKVAPTNTVSTPTEALNSVEQNLTAQKVTSTKTFTRIKNTNNSVKDLTSKEISPEELAKQTPITNTVSFNNPETTTITAIAKELTKPVNEANSKSTYVIIEKAFDEDEKTLASNQTSGFWQKAKKAINGLNKMGVKNVSVAESNKENSEQHLLSLGNLSIENKKFIEP